MTVEKRGHTRVEPPLMIASLQEGSAKPVYGVILDSSRKGLAINLKNGNTALNTKSLITVVLLADPNTPHSIGTGKIVRMWENSITGRNCIAIELSNEVPCSGPTEILFKGSEKENRVEAQKDLALGDIKNLEEERRYLLECQMKLYIASLTFGISIMSLYFGLAYYSTSTGVLNSADLSFWRTLVAALPGFIAISCALMASQKTSSLQRVTSFLVILKNCLIKNEFPREYKGWEALHRKFRYLHDSSKCSNNICEENKCGKLLSHEQRALENRGIFRKPYINLFHLLVFSTFCLMGAISIAMVVIEVLRFQKGISIYMIISSILTVTMLGGGIGVWALFWHLRKGRLSFERYRRAQLDLMTICQYPK